MNYIHFTFNNFFDYSIITEQLKSERWKFHPNNLTATFNYHYTRSFVIDYIEGLGKPLNIQFTTTSEVTENSE